MPLNKFNGLIFIGGGAQVYIRKYLRDTQGQKGWRGIRYMQYRIIPDK